MASVCLISFILYIVSHFGESHAGTNENLPVCVIGGGISGINLGILLQEKGYEVQVFEKLEKVGGKIDTFTIDDEVLVEMCPILFATPHTSILKYVDQFNLTKVPYNMQDRKAFDPRSGIIRSFPVPDLKEMQEAVVGYINYRSKLTSEMDFGYVHATPDLFDPISTWLTNNNLTALTPLLEALITLDGYGSMHDTPALYMLKFFSVEFLKVAATISGSYYTLQEGLSVLVSKMASLLKNLHVNRELIDLKRNEDHQVIYLKNPKNNFIERRICGRTILAFPPLLSNLENIISDLNFLERQVLNQVKITKYASAAHHIPFLTHNIYADGIKLLENGTVIYVEPTGDGGIIALVNQSFKKMKNVYTSYSWERGSFSAMPSDTELNEMTIKINDTLRKISIAPKTLHEIKTTEYFPHALPESLKNGFYRDFESIQGHNGLYYASTILTFEELDEALKMTEAFVGKYFKRRTTLRTPLKTL